MKRRINGLYPLSYSAYWHSKGEYGKKRIERMHARKQARKDKRKAIRKERAKYCRCCGRYLDDW